MIDERLVDYLALGRLPGMKASLARELLAVVGDASEVMRAPADRLVRRTHCHSRLFDTATRQQTLDDASREARFIDAHNVRLLRFDDESGGYPRALAAADDAPVALMALGDCDFNQSAIAIVGTRHSTAYGMAFVDELVKAVAASSVSPKPLIVSGLAYGIDATAHRAALREGLPTVAVLAHGLNTIYPAAHRNLARDIVGKGGALVTEYISTDAVHRGNFLARNRIVAAMCQATIIVESDLKGGAMATARLAADYDRDVYALPGRTTDRYSRGCNSLIAKDRARIITSAADLAEQLGWPAASSEAVQQTLFDDLNPEQRQIVEYLQHNGESRLADLRAVTGHSVQELLNLLVEMEFNGILKAFPGSRYALS